MVEQAGVVVLFGSGETAASGRRVFDWLFSQATAPVQMAVLETPAGFQPNSQLVADGVAQFVRNRLPHHRPEVSVIPARRKGAELGPDNPEVLLPLLRADVVFLGPGSPTYAVRHLEGTLAWEVLRARHRAGAAIVFASAATAAASAYTLPVYEIYKAGEDLHWRRGLDFFSDFGLSLVFVPHWNNVEGGAGLDTSRCFMGRDRFASLLRLLPAGQTVVGIDEHTALIFDLPAARCLVMGKGGIAVLRGEREDYYPAGMAFSTAALGALQTAPTVELPQAFLDHKVAAPSEAEPPSVVLDLVAERESARERGEWALADGLRTQIAELGWRVADTRQGPLLRPLGADPTSYGLR